MKENMILYPKLSALVLIGLKMLAEMKFIIKINELLAENKIKKRLKTCCLNVSIEMIFMNTENRKMNEPNKFVLNLS